MLSKSTKGTSTAVSSLVYQECQHHVPLCAFNALLANWAKSSIVLDALAGSPGLARPLKMSARVRRSLAAQSARLR
jgi:hypothetical protein